MAEHAHFATSTSNPPPLITPPIGNHCRTFRVTVFYTRFVGQTRPVLWESAEKDNRMSGFTDNHIRVERPFDEALSGTIEPVVLGRMNERGLAESPEMEMLPVLS